MRQCYEKESRSKSMYPRKHVTILRKTFLHPLTSAGHVQMVWENKYTLLLIKQKNTQLIYITYTTGIIAYLGRSDKGWAYNMPAMSNA